MRVLHSGGPGRPPGVLPLPPLPVATTCRRPTTSISRATLLSGSSCRACDRGWSGIVDGAASWMERHRGWSGI
eukprot:366453-Chlamydomonas_euryale.AAC.1